MNRINPVALTQTPVRANMVNLPGTTLTGLTEITPAQKSLFAALALTPPTPSDLAKPVL